MGSALSRRAYYSSLEKHMGTSGPHAVSLAAATAKHVAGRPDELVPRLLRDDGRQQGVELPRVHALTRRLNGRRIGKDEAVPEGCVVVLEALLQLPARACASPQHPRFS